MGQLKPTDGGRTVALHGRGPLHAASIIDHALQKLSQDQAATLLERAAGEALRLEVKSREIEIEYAYGKKAAEDHIETFDMLERGGKTTRQKVASEISTGAGKMRIESKSGATCFVATAAYRNTDHPNVTFLRMYRNNTLRNNKYGQIFVVWYWHQGPRIAEFVERSTWLQALARHIINTVVLSLRVVESASSRIK